MKKTIISLVLMLICLAGFTQAKPEEKKEVKLKFEFTVADIDVIYAALGKLPAETVERIRMYIVQEYTKQTQPATPAKKDEKPAVKKEDEPKPKE